MAGKNRFKSKKGLQQDRIPDYDEIPASFYLRRTEVVARQIIGMLLLRQLEDVTVATIIVEAEAYREDDPASHSFRGPTPRCEVMFEPGGVAYVYRSYGIHSCLNIVTEAKGFGCAVLIRAVEPLNELERLWERRFPCKAYNVGSGKELTNGPGKLTRALDIDVDRFNGHHLDTPPLMVVRPIRGRAVHVCADTRIGVSRGKETKWRFYDSNSRFVSRRRLPA